MDFDYHPAFKVSAGIGFNRDDWTACVEYTRFHSKDSNHKTISKDNLTELLILSTWNASNQTFASKADWKLKNDLIDLSFGRPYYLGKKIVIKPHFGLRGGWIDQKYHLEETFLSDDTELNSFTNVKSDSWLIGPRAGVKTNWLLGKGFNFFGNIATSLFYQDFSTKYNYNYTTIVLETTRDISVNEKQDNHYITPNLECALGLGWGSYFAKNKAHFNLSAGYEFHIFWNQNLMKSLAEKVKSGTGSTSDGSITETKEGDLMLHGLTVSARFDF